MMKIMLTAGAIALLCLSGPLGVSTAEAKKMDKVGAALDHVYKRHMAKQDKAASKTAKSSEAAMEDKLFVANTTSDGYVVVDVVASGATADLEATMASLGARNVSSRGRTVSAQLPIASLPQLSASADVKFARPALAVTNVGLTTSQGDRSMRTDLARTQFDVDGEGLTVGVLSDSFGCEPGSLAGGPFTTVAEDIANDDLPEDVTILEDFLDVNSCIDEGRGMAQLIHDVAPGAAIAFHTAFNGEADFAQGIIELALAGSDVIVDDVIYFAEPMFQDGIIAQAADEAARLGVPYYSSNGNRARDSYQSDFRPVAATVGGIAGTWHDFDSGPGEDLLKSVNLTWNASQGLAQITLSFQWDEPFFSVSGAPGSASDVDLIMFDSAGVPVAECFDAAGNFVFPANGLCQFFFTDSANNNIDGGVGGDAVDLLSVVSFLPGTASVQIGFNVQAGPAPNLVKYVRFPNSGTWTDVEYDTKSPSGYGHNNAAGAEGVGAAAFFFTEEFIGDPRTLQVRAMAGEPECIPACLNDFSSAGGTPVAIKADGTRFSTPQIRLKPGITGPDGGNTSFFINDTSRDDDDGDGVFQTGEPGEFPNFFGTSAAAPHAAAVAALMIDLEGSEILEVKKNGKVKYNLCKPKKGKRSKGTDITVSPNALSAQLNNGALLGPCDRTEPDGIYGYIRDTAQDMNVRAGLNTGATVGTFDEVGPDGFDYDSGFGFIDAKKALWKFEDDLDDDDDHGHGGGHGGGHGHH